MHAPVALHGVVVDLGQSVPSAHHDLVQFGVPQAADDALEQTDRDDQMQFSDLC